MKCENFRTDVTVATSLLNEDIGAGSDCALDANNGYTSMTKSCKL